MSREHIDTRMGRNGESDSENGKVVGLVGEGGGFAGNSSNHPQPPQVDCSASTSNTLD